MFNPVCAMDRFSHDYLDQPLFQECSIDFPYNQWTMILGKSGVGKSTLLKILAGFIRPKEGIIHRYGRTAYLTQRHTALPWLNVLDNVLLPWRLQGVFIEKNHREQAHKVLALLGLEAHQHKKPKELSAGMLQRLMLARILLDETPVVLLDEPLSALDALTRDEMQTVLHEHLKGKTVVMVTHDVGEALRLGDRILVLSGTPVSVQVVALPGRPMRDVRTPEIAAIHVELIERLK